jgi:hypothetical protein
MKTRTLILALALMSWVQTVTAQISVTITNPSLTMPYQVPTGTQVTFTWSAMGTPPTTMFSDVTAPTVQQNLPPVSTWTHHPNFVTTGSTSSLTLTVNNDIWVWGGLSGFLGWQYSNVVAVQAISAMVITSSDSLICPTNGSVVLTAPTGTGYTYQWYEDTIAIAGATNGTYTTTTAGSFYCVVNGTNTTNTLHISEYESSFQGAYNGSSVTLTSDQTFTSYQWMSRTGSGSATPIAGATNASYTAPITSTATYYSLEGTTPSGCVINSLERMIESSLFAVPTITLNATPNGQGYICEGTAVSIVSTSIDSLTSWLKNGNPSFSNLDSINLYGSYHNGAWTAEVMVLGWPEITLTSNSVNVTITSLITPQLTGGNYYDPFCNGDAVNFILTDEGYNYTWYKHDSLHNYNSSNQISVPNGVYQTTFNGDTMVTVEAEFNGCYTTTTIALNGWENERLYTSLSNWDQQYLCIDSTITVSVGAWQASNYQNFQWYKLILGTWTAINNANTTAYTVTDPGKYMVSANPISCASAVVSSDTVQIYSYLDRQPSIYTLDPTICQGEETTLRLSGSSSWYAMQWLSADVAMGSSGYERVYTGMLNNSATDTQLVDAYGAYRISAKHNSCPNGLKVKSEPIFITPTVSPTIELVTPMDLEPSNIIAWDSALNYIGCINEPVTMTLDDTNYFDIAWHGLVYLGDDDYALGNQFTTGSFADTTMDAIWITAVVTDSNGCKGQTSPILLDARVFQLPAIASTNNSELCNPGDSTLLHLGFPGTWTRFEWTVDGDTIPNSDNDSIWAKQLGEYVIIGYPAACPDMPHSSGIGPVVKYLYAGIQENDSLLYAIPQLGFYSYQWFFNGDSINPTDPNRPWVFHKDSLQEGVYTVAVSNDNCTKISDDYVVEFTSTGELNLTSVSLYPNPANNQINLKGLVAGEKYTAQLLNTNGTVVLEQIIYGNAQLDVSHLPTGIYALSITNQENSTLVVKCVIR